MKLYLDESLFEDYLVEDKSLLALLSNRKYNARGFWQTPVGKQVLSTTLGKGLRDNNYVAHHINGIHPTSNDSEFNDASNIAILPNTIHHQLTDDNNKIVKDTLEESFGDHTLGSYIMNLLTYAINKNINLDKYFEIKENKYSEIVDNILNNITTHFYEFKETHDDIYLVRDILSQEEE